MGDHRNFQVNFCQLDSIIDHKENTRLRTVVHFILILHIGSGNQFF